jgi:hypothetical protein
MVSKNTINTPVSEIFSLKIGPFECRNVQNSTLVSNQKENSRKNAVKKRQSRENYFSKNPKSLVEMAEIFQKSETSRNSANLTRKDVNITI